MGSKKQSLWSKINIPIRRKPLYFVNPSTENAASVCRGQLLKGQKSICIDFLPSVTWKTIKNERGKHYYELLGTHTKTSCPGRDVLDKNYYWHTTVGKNQNLFKSSTYLDNFILKVKSLELRYRLIKWFLLIKKPKNSYLFSLFFLVLLWIFFLTKNGRNTMKHPLRSTFLILWSSPLA